MNEELKHYGVKGMKWGVRRASNQLSKSTSKEERDKAVARLQKHRTKATNKIAKLESQHVKLQKKSDQYAMKNDIKAQKLKSKAAKKSKKAYGRFTSKNKADKLMYEAGKLNARADAMIAKSETAKAKIAKNEKMTAAFKQGVSTIDKTLIEKGRKYING